MHASRFGRFIATAHTTAVLALVGLAASGCQPAHKWAGEVLVDPRPAPELAGVNWDGQPFKLSDQKGKVAIVFFGYTYCPDICPMTLATLKSLYNKLGDKANEVAVVFVSVDPHRDSVEKLSRYVPNFDERFYGLRLEFHELDEVQEDWNVTVQLGQPQDGPGTNSFYYVDHTGSFFVIDREGILRLTFPPNSRPDRMLPDIEYLLASS